MTEVAPGVFLHVDDAGVLAIEVLDLSSRGGLQVGDLDARPGERPAPTQVGRNRCDNGLKA